MRLALFAALLALPAAPSLAGEGPAGAAEKPCTTRDVANGFIPLFYEQGKVREAYETWVAEDYIQHNPHATDGRDAAIAFLEPFYQRNPTHRMTVHRVLVDGDLIAVHLHGQTGPDDRGAAAVDILRVKDCKIVEHWDVTQPVPEKSANPNGMF
ncbi:nuclear transport factor 2 family protein [Altererythrobacter fulvus]|uniref:nuclear transport factor 2 family protein n=1 Tax=Caenibius fulvus TaxID=2126012 RepID=UPI003017C788